MIVREDVSDWFPELYLPTEARLAGEKFTIEAAVQDYFESIGSGSVSRYIFM